MLLNPCETEGQEELIAGAVGESADRNARVRMSGGTDRRQHIRAFVVVDVEPRERLIG